MSRKRGGRTRKTKLKTRRRDPKKRVGKRKTHRRKLRAAAVARPRKVSLEDILKSGKVYKLSLIHI